MTMACLRILVVYLVASAPWMCHGLATSQQSNQNTDSSSLWRPLPHVHQRRQILSTAAPAAVLSGILGGPASYAFTSTDSHRGVASVDSHAVIPVWPTWGGGRVVPISLGGPLHDPFLLLAHHKHWFDPRDPLRGPFKVAGKALGLPYVDVEGFSMHPHRGLDILTYVLDGSDGFQHRDSLTTDASTTRIYRGGSAQWMRCGAGVLHEEFWETRPDRRTDIELFQIWVNLPASQKFDEPAIHYIGTNTENPWIEEKGNAGVNIRDIGETLTGALRDNVKSRPPVNMKHVTLEPGAEWAAQIPQDHSAMLYVREGAATLPQERTTAKALQTITLGQSGRGNTSDDLVIQNKARREKLDLLLLTAAPLREPVAWGGPIVMNTNEELNDAYRQLQNGTFLKRNVALEQHAETLRRQSARSFEA